MSLDIYKHKIVLIKILKDIYMDTTLGPILGFKGGTAANLFYKLDRFSVDLDFDLIDESKEDYIFQRVGEILSSYGTLKEKQKKRSTLFFLLSYSNKELTAQNIKIEINRRHFESHYHLESYLGIPMKVMNMEDMNAHKLVAMLERIGKTNRDIYDLNFFLHSGWPINKKIVEDRTNMAYKMFINKCIKALGKLTNKDILSGLGELLNEKQKIWAKTHLIEDTLFLLSLELENEK